MRILLTNDDGVKAPSLWAIHEALRGLGEVTVVAPCSEQSGVGHAITYRTPITAECVRTESGVQAHAVDGTPADCVKFALLEVLSEPPDLVVSGINLGMNLGCNVFYSGTVAAAIEGAMYGLPSVAVSTCASNSERLQAVAAQALRALRLILERGGPQGIAYNVNVPALLNGDPDILFTHHRRGAFRDQYLRQDCNGVPGYQLDLRQGAQEPAVSGSDVHAVGEGMISVTPLSSSLTDMESLRAMDCT